MRRKTWLITGGILLIVLIYFFATYNSLVNKQESVRLNWSNLQSVYQRRVDLIPGLVSVVKGVSEYEKKVMTELAAARARAAQLSLPAEINFSAYQQLEQVQGDLANAANNAVAITENYPDLKSTKNFHYLQTQLEGTERRIKLARIDFNKSVAEYNRKVRRFPSSMVSGLTGFKSMEGFSTDAKAANAPEVKF